MGKRAKEHRRKVAKRNANLKQQEKQVQKLWQEAFEEQMNVMREKFAAMSGDTMSGLTGLFEDEDTTTDEVEVETTEIETNEDYNEVKISLDKDLDDNLETHSEEEN